MGKNKIEIVTKKTLAEKKITFGKRKDGLLKKGRELSILCDVPVMVLFFSPTDNTSHYIFVGEKCNFEGMMRLYSAVFAEERHKRKLDTLSVLEKLLSKGKKKAHVIKDLTASSSGRIEAENMQNGPSDLPMQSLLDAINGINEIGLLEVIEAELLNALQGLNNVYGQFQVNHATNPHLQFLIQQFQGNHATCPSWHTQLQVKQEPGSSWHQQLKINHAPGPSCQLQFQLKQEPGSFSWHPQFGLNHTSGTSSSWHPPSQANHALGASSSWHPPSQANHAPGASPWHPQSQANHAPGASSSRHLPSQANHAPGASSSWHPPSQANYAPGASSSWHPPSQANHAPGASSSWHPPSQANHAPGASSSWHLQSQANHAPGPSCQSQFQLNHEAGPSWHPQFQVNDAAGPSSCHPFTAMRGLELPMGAKEEEEKKRK